RSPSSCSSSLAGSTRSNRRLLTTCSRRTGLYTPCTDAGGSGSPRCLGAALVRESSWRPRQKANGVRNIWRHWAATSLVDEDSRGVNHATHARPENRASVASWNTLSRAQAIVALQQLSPHDPLYVVFESNRDLAEVFAGRKAARESGLPAVVRIVIEDADFQNMGRRGEALLIPFDAGDDPYLRARNQWVISRGGVKFMNDRLLDVESQMLPS